MMSVLFAYHLQTAELQPTVSFIDSRDDSKITYVIVNDSCKVKIKKTELRDYDSVVEKVFKACGY